MVKAIDSRAVYTSSSDEWETPQAIYDDLDREFHFDLDPCATPENHKCSEYYTIADDGLLKNWGGRRVFCNPPYSKIGNWVEKAYRESREDKTIVVLLIPSRTDTKYFHDYIYNRAEIRFVKGRLRFSNATVNAPFPSMIVIFRGAKADY